MEFDYLTFRSSTTMMRLKWPANDKQTFAIIKEDWNESFPYIQELVKERKNVIQAGGHCGLYPILYSEGYNYVFTFEPDVDNFSCLLENCDPSKVIKFNNALGSENGIIGVEAVNSNNTGMNRISNRNTGVLAYCTTIDNFDFPDVSLIHLDIEGLEFEAIKGAQKTITKHRPVVVLEMGGNREKIVDFMTSLKYSHVISYGKHPPSSIFVYNP